MKGFQNTHFYVAEIPPPPRKQNKYNAHIHHINCHIRQICANLSNADYLPTPVKKQHLYRGVINNDQVSKIRVLSWNINVLGNKMTDPDLFTFIRNYDIIFFIETIKGNDFTLAIPGYKLHHVSRKPKHKNACRASGGIGILISNKYANLTRIDHTYVYLVWITLATDCRQKNIKIGCTYIPPEKHMSV